MQAGPGDAATDTKAGSMSWSLRAHPRAASRGGRGADGCGARGRGGR